MEDWDSLRLRPTYEFRSSMFLDNRRQSTPSHRRIHKPLDEGGRSFGVGDEPWDEFLRCEDAGR